VYVCLSFQGIASLDLNNTNAGLKLNEGQVDNLQFADDNDLLTMKQTTTTGYYDTDWRKQ